MKNTPTEKLEKLINSSYELPIEDIFKLLDAGADINAQFHNDNTLLHLFAIRGRNKHLKRLVQDYRARINQQNLDGETPLAALMNDDISVPLKTAMLLIELGADPHTTDNQGRTFLYRLQEENLLLKDENRLAQNNKALAILMQHEKINKKNILSPIQVAMQNPWKYPTKQIMDLIRHGGDPNIKDANGDFFIHWLARMGQSDKDFIKELVEKYHVDVNQLNDKKETPLEYLLNRSAEDGVNQYFCADTAMVLVSLGANPHTKDNRGICLLHRLQLNHKAANNTLAIQTLIKDYHVQTALLTKLECMLYQMPIDHPRFASEFYVQSVQVLLLEGQDPKTKDFHGNTLLHYFIKSYGAASVPCDTNFLYNAIITLLNDYKLDPTISNHAQETPLEWLLNSKHFGGNLDNQLAMELVRHNANPNTQNEKGKSLLHFLAYHHQISDIEELVHTYHADVNIKDVINQTPLELMIEHNFSIETGLTLARLGASNKELLKHKIAGLNDESKWKWEALDSLANIHQGYRSQYINFLLFLVYERSNERETGSWFKYLNGDLLAYILSFLAYDMEKTQNEAFLLAKKMLSSTKEIKAFLSKPGGFNVYQRGSATSKSITYQFYKSAKTFCLDYAKLETKLQKEGKEKISKWKRVMGKKYTSKSKKILSEAQELAIQYWESHSGLFFETTKKLQLKNAIVDKPPYSNIKNELKIIINK